MCEPTHSSNNSTSRLHHHHVQTASSTVADDRTGRMTEFHGANDCLAIRCSSLRILNDIIVICSYDDDARTCGRRRWGAHATARFKLARSTHPAAEVIKHNSPRLPKTEEIDTKHDFLQCVCMHACHLVVGCCCFFSIFYTGCLLVRHSMLMLITLLWRRIVDLSRFFLLFFLT